MSKYVCDACGMCLSSKYALERHGNTARCIKNQRDLAKKKLEEGEGEGNAGANASVFAQKPLYDCHFTAIAGRSPTSTVFRNVYGRTRSTPIRKRYHEKVFPDGIVIPDGAVCMPLSRELSINQNNTTGHKLHNLKFSQRANPLLSCTTFDNYDNIKVYYNDVKIFDLDMDTIYFILGINPAAPPVCLEIPLTDMIFGKDTYIPLGKLLVTVGLKSGGRTGATLVATYDTYVLCKEEAQREMNTAMELFYNCWFSTNIKDTIGAEHLTTPTQARVAEIYYQDNDNINPDCAGRRDVLTEMYHYNCLPEGKDTGSFTDMLFTSLIPPCVTLYKKPTEAPVIVRYISVLRAEDGEASTYADLYVENPKLSAKREIYERLMKYKEGEHYDTTMVVPGKLNHAITKMNIDGTTYHTPIGWSDSPKCNKLPLFEPNWFFLKTLISTDIDALPAVLARDCIEMLETFVKYCGATHLDNFKILKSHGLDRQYDYIDGVYEPGYNLYCFKSHTRATGNSRWYAVTDAHLKMYRDYMVPMNNEMYYALAGALQTCAPIPPTPAS